MRNSAKIASASIFLGIFLTPVTYALPENICKIRADLGASFALERDKGTDKNKVYDQVKREMGKTFADNSKPYIDLVYEHPNASPSEIRMVFYQTCLRE